MTDQYTTLANLPPSIDRCVLTSRLPNKVNLYSTSRRLKACGREADSGKMERDDGPKRYHMVGVAHEQQAFILSSSIKGARLSYAYDGYDR